MSGLNDPLSRFLAAFRKLPTGSFRGHTSTGQYIVSKTAPVEGRSYKLVAEQLDGPVYISLNLYLTGTGAKLRPCEMPAAKVIAFVLALKPDET